MTSRLELEDRVPAILESVQVAEILAEHGHESTRRAGTTSYYRCPFDGHEDRNPSFAVKDNRWKCWSACSTGGDVIDLVVALEKVSKAEAIESLAQRIGMDRQEQRQHHRGRPQGEAVRLLERFAAERGWCPEAVAEAGLHVVLDAFGRSRVRFPYIYDTEIVWYQDRLIGEGEPKWLAAKGSKPALFRANALRLAHKCGGCWVVEGPCDVLAITSTFETPAVVGVPGAHNFSRQWVRAFEGLRQVYVIADNDPAGARLRDRLDSLLGPVVGKVLQLEVPSIFNDVDAWRRGLNCDTERFLDGLMRAMLDAQVAADQGTAL